MDPSHSDTDITHTQTLVYKTHMSIAPRIRMNQSPLISSTTAKDG